MNAACKVVGETSAAYVFAVDYTVVVADRFAGLVAAASAAFPEGSPFGPGTSPVGASLPKSSFDDQSFY